MDANCSHRDGAGHTHHRVTNLKFPSRVPTWKVALVTEPAAVSPYRLTNLHRVRIKETAVLRIDEGLRMMEGKYVTRAGTK